MSETKNPFPDLFDSLSVEEKMKMLETMIRIRTFETHVEELFDRALLGPGVLPPLAFEGNDLAVAVREAGRRVGAGVDDDLGGHGLLTHDVQRSTLRCSWTFAATLTSE